MRDTHDVKVRIIVEQFLIAVDDVRMVDLPGQLNLPRHPSTVRGLHPSIVRDLVLLDELHSHLVARLAMARTHDEPVASIPELPRQNVRPRELGLEQVALGEVLREHTRLPIRSTGKLCRSIADIG